MIPASAVVLGVVAASEPAGLVWCLCEDCSSGKGLAN